jgi:hypothetical protein
MKFQWNLRTTGLFKFSYCRLSTNLKKHLNSDGTPKSGFEPITEVDEVCMHHDYNYQLLDHAMKLMK